MSDTVLPTHEALLRLCASVAPKPLYPKAYAQTSGVPRDTLDVLLNELRIAELIRLTDWEKGTGQGNVITELGQEVLNNPVFLAQLRTSLEQAQRMLEPSPATPDNQNSTRYDRGDAARKSLYEPEPPRVMPVLLLVNLIAFGVSLYVAIRAGVPMNQFITKGDVTVLHEVGALSAVDLLRGEWWRLLTNCFLHFGLMHLLLNMYCLYSLGLLESLWGRARFLLLYLASGIGGSCAAMLYNPTEADVLAGASGAIWGLMASLVAWVLMNRSHLPPEDLARWYPRIGLLFLINLGVSFIPGVSATAHFGGGGVGLIMATLLHVQRIAPPPRRTAATVLCALLPVLCIAALAEAMEKDERWLRIADSVKKRLQQNAEMHFKQQVLPAIDKADAAFEALESTAYIVTDKQLIDRKSDARLPKLRDDLQSAKYMVRIAREKLPANPYAEQSLEKARTAGRDYLQAASDLIDRFEQLLDQEAVWDKEERIATAAKMRKALNAWKEIRGQF